MRSPEPIGVHHPVGAGLQHPPLGAFVDGPGDDDEAGVQRPRGQHGIEVMGVVGQTADEPAGVLDVRGAQRSLAGGVPGHHRALGPRLLAGLDPRLDHHDFPAGPPQRGDSGAAHTPVAADDVVTAHLFDHADSPYVSQIAPQFAFHDRPADLGRHEQEDADAAPDQGYRQRLARRRQRKHVAEPDGGDGDDRHVEGIPPGHALDQPVADRAGGEQRRSQRRRPQQPVRRRQDGRARVGVGRGEHTLRALGHRPRTDVARGSASSGVDDGRHEQQPRPRAERRARAGVGRRGERSGR